MPKRAHTELDHELDHVAIDEPADAGISAPSPAKFIQREEDDDTGSKSSEGAHAFLLECHLPHDGFSSVNTRRFKTVQQYEEHVLKAHSHGCSICHNTFPSQHYLDLHISEHHDSFMDARRARGDKTYRCLVKGCERECSTPQKRRLHVIDKHNFPKSYNFWVIKDGHFRQRRALASSKADINVTPGDPSDSPENDKSVESDAHMRATSGEMDAGLAASLRNLGIGSRANVSFGHGQRAGFERN